MGRVENGIVMLTPEQNVSHFLIECGQMIDALVTRKLTVLGEECVKRVRDRSASESWIDHTGNLRSSIGYSVISKGKPIKTGGFNRTSAPDGSGAEGIIEGKSYIEQVMRFYYQDYALVVVAGMNYADEVEALDNKDVLASTELWAKSVWATYQKELKADIKKQIKSLESKYGLA